MTRIRRSGRRRIGLLLLGLAATSQALCADEPLPSPQLGEIRPVGIDGRLLLCAPAAAAEDVLAALPEPRSDSRLWLLVIGRGGPSRLTIEQLQHRSPRGTYQFTAHWSELNGFPQSKPPTGFDFETAWIHAESPLPSTGPLLGQFRRFAEQVWSQRGTLVLSGRAAEAIGEQIHSVTDKGPQLSAGSGAIPGILWRTAPSGDDDEVLVTPGRVQLHLDAQAILKVEGRTLTIPNGCAAGATLWLPPGQPETPRSVRIDLDHPADLTILRRVAVLRSTAATTVSELKSPHVSKGALMIVGGGATQDDVMQRFVELAGGRAAQIVVVPTASEQWYFEDHRDAQRFRDAGAGEVTILHTHDRNRAGRREFLGPLERATGVWFPGGRQWRLVDAYEGTPFVQLCQQVLDRGGVIGGTSAGATIQGEYLVRGHPLGNEVMMAEGYERGFGFLPGAAIDQHFSQRKREGDLEAVKREHPHLTCLGIDESTALLVRGSFGEVLGQGTVSIYDAPRDASGDQLVRRSIVKSGETYDFQARTVLRQAAGPEPDN